MQVSMWRVPEVVSELEREDDNNTVSRVSSMACLLSHKEHAAYVLCRNETNCAPPCENNDADSTQNPADCASVID